MAKSLASLRKVKAVNPPSVIAYGVHGVGKTSFASEWPDPVFIQVEQGTPGGMELSSFGEIETFDDVMDAITALCGGGHEFKTVVVDSLDAMEPLLWAACCKRNGWASIEDAGYGKGYVAADDLWRDYLGGMKHLTTIGMATVQIAHSDITRFDSPVSDPYSRYGIKLHKRAGALVQEDADIVAFFNYRTMLKEAQVGFNNKVVHAEGGGQRQMHFEERPGFLAKNRYQMPSKLDYVRGKGYEAIKQYFPEPTGVVK